MLNIKIVFILILISFVKKSYSQEYRTYTTNSIPFHTICLKNDTLVVQIPKNNIISFQEISKFLIKKRRDTIFILDKIIYKNKKRGLIFPNQFINQFTNKKINIKPNNQLVINNNPYFKTELVFELISTNTIYYINGKLFKVAKNLDENKIDLEKILDKLKRVKIKILDGKQAYEKYGIIGLNGVIEVFGKKKRCK